MASKQWFHKVRERFTPDQSQGTRKCIRSQRHSRLRGNPLEIGSGNRYLILRPFLRLTPPQRFTQCGFDILDAEGSISVLTNCGCFPGIFAPSAVNQWGLLDQLDNTNQIALQIRTRFPDDSHCQNCQVWQVARAEDTLPE
jgi:hypothetical protein